MNRIAIVFGHSEWGIDLSKQLLLTFYDQVISITNTYYTVDVYPYLCNFVITDINSFCKGLNYQELDIDPDSFRYDPPSEENWTEYFNSISWAGTIRPKNCYNKDFLKFYLPDVAVYHDFATKYADDYDLVLYCHNDIVFENPEKKDLLEDWSKILAYKSQYSIIAEMRAICNKDFSLRFHCCFILTNTRKFNESQLSFINDHELINGNDFYVYSNGGTGLLSSFYRKQDDKPRWQPYLISTHGVYRDITINDKNDKWFNHICGVEWNRTRNMSDGGSVERTKSIYNQAKKRVAELLQ